MCGFYGVSGVIEKAVTHKLDGKANVEANAARPVPAWLELNNETLSGKVVRLASREDVDIPVEEHLIVELYSK